MSKSKLELMMEEKKLAEKKAIAKEMAKEKRMARESESCRKKDFNKAIAPLRKIVDLKVDGLWATFKYHKEKYCLQYKPVYCEGTSDGYPSGDYWGWYLSRELDNDGTQIELRGEGDGDWRKENEKIDEAYDKDDEANETIVQGVMRGLKEIEERR